MAASRDTGDTRARLLDATAANLARHGFAGTGVNAVLAQSGTTNSSLYHHFPGGKAELAAAAMLQVGMTTRHLIDELLADGIPSAVDAIFEAGAAQLVDDHFDAGCRVATPVADGSDEPRVREAGAEVFASWEDAIATALVDAGWPADDARAMALVAITLYEGALVMGRAERSRRPLDEAARAVHDLLATRAPATNRRR